MWEQLGKTYTNSYLNFSRRVNLLRYKDTKKSQGAAFVEFAMPTLAQKVSIFLCGTFLKLQALELDGTQFANSTIKVNPGASKPSISTNPFCAIDKYSQRERIQSFAKLTTVLPCTLATFRGEQTLIHLQNVLAYFSTNNFVVFQKCGTVIRVSLPVWRNTGKRRNFAMVEFQSSSCVPIACKLDGTTLDGRLISVSPLTDTAKKHRNEAIRKRNLARKLQKKAENEASTTKPDEHPEKAEDLDEIAPPAKKRKLSGTPKET